MKEHLKKLSGTPEEKKELFEMFLAKLQSGQPLADAEIPMFEFLKKEILGGDDGV